MTRLRRQGWRTPAVVIAPLAAWLVAFFAASELVAVEAEQTADSLLAQLGQLGAQLGQSIAPGLGADLSLADPAVALPQVVNLARLDPALAASLIPDGWIDEGIESARRVAHEEPRRHAGALAPPTWPIGPWRSGSEVETSIRSLDPAAAAALYGALEPRLAGRCQAMGASFARCEQELRMSLDRLTARAVAERAAGRDTIALTETQLEFARMGTQVVVAGREKLGAVARAIWP